MSERALAAVPPRSDRALWRMAPESAARRLLLRHLDKADTALHKLAHGEDAHALHDFRVALRRFRAMERAYRPWLDDAVPQKLRRRLRDLVRLTGPARDAEVQLDWLQGQREGLHPAQMAGYRWLLARIEDRQRDAAARVRDEVVSAFPALAGRLSAGLRLACAESDSSLARATGERLKPLLAELSAELSACAEGQGDIHPARLLAKQVRYLLEPVAEALAEGEVLVREVTQLQDLLGDINDSRVLAQTVADAAGEAATAQWREQLQAALHELVPARRADGRPGLIALARRLGGQERHRLVAFRTLREQGADQALMDRLAIATRQLLAAPL